MVVRIVCLALLAVLLSGCKIFIKVPANGSVTTESGRYGCMAGKTCDVDVVDLFFNQVFIAVPEDGFVFAGWEKADRHFCGGSRENCHLRTSRFEGNDLLMGLLERDDEIFYLAPVFVDPDSEELIQLKISGNWDYVQTWGDCSASGRIEQILNISGGLYQTYTADSQRVTNVESCRTITAGQLLSRTVGPIITIGGEPLSGYEIEDAYRADTGLRVTVEVISKAQYSVSIMRDGVAETFVFTRPLGDGPTAGI